MLDPYQGPTPHEGSAPGGDVVQPLELDVAAPTLAEEPPERSATPTPAAQGTAGTKRWWRRSSNSDEVAPVEEPVTSKTESL
ncbi:MAG: hypothetical protein LH630_03300, partial [Actinomycetia bacterium]|nr:hypothetical protein [Actinomycetes bacterium]